MLVLRSSQSQFGSTLSVPKYFVWTWGRWDGMLPNYHMCWHEYYPREGIKAWIAMSQSYVPRMVTLRLVAPGATPIISAGWSNAKNPCQLARVVTGRNMEIYDSDIYVLYLHLHPSLLLEGGQDVTPGNGLHVIQASRGFEQVSHEDLLCRLPLPGSCVFTVCCDVLERRVSFELQGDSRTLTYNLPTLWQHALPRMLCTEHFASFFLWSSSPTCPLVSCTPMIASNA